MLIGEYPPTVYYLSIGECISRVEYLSRSTNIFSLCCIFNHLFVKLTFLQSSSCPLFDSVPYSKCHWGRDHPNTTAANEFKPDIRTSFRSTPTTGNSNTKTDWLVLRVCVDLPLATLSATCA